MPGKEAIINLFQYVVPLHICICCMQGTGILAWFKNLYASSSQIQ